MQSESGSICETYEDSRGNEARTSLAANGAWWPVGSCQSILVWLDRGKPYPLDFPHYSNRCSRNRLYFHADTGIQLPCRRFRYPRSFSVGTQHYSSLLDRRLPPFGGASIISQARSWVGEFPTWLHRFGLYACAVHNDDAWGADQKSVKASSHCMKREANSNHRERIHFWTTSLSRLSAGRGDIALFDDVGILNRSPGEGDAALDIAAARLNGGDWKPQSLTQISIDGRNIRDTRDNWPEIREEEGLSSVVPDGECGENPATSVEACKRSS